MTHTPLFALGPARRALAPADGAAGASAETGGAVLEIVSFRLKPGIDTDAYLAAARATEAFLRETGAVCWRRLARDADGLWTDVLEWRSMAEAKAAEAAAMARPEFAAFFEAFDPGTLEIRHAGVLWSMD
jgi:hypothetical protein